MKPVVVLATIGSLGDLHPFIALGLALRARGARAVVACAADYRAKVERAGLEFRAVRPSFGDLQAELGMDRAELTRAVLRHGDFLLRRLIAPYVRPSYEDMVDIVGDADLVMTSSLSFGARLAAERRGIPWIGIVLQPLMFLSAFDPPEIPEAEWLSRVLRHLGPRTTRWVLALAKHTIDRQLRPVHALRREVGLPPFQGNPLFEGQFSPAGALGLYSPLIGGPQPDHPAATEIIGFASFDSDDGGPASLAPQLSEFLDAGTPPVVFTLGSLIVNFPGSFFRESVAAARALGMRAVLLVGESGVLEHAGLEAGDVYVCGYAPHSLLFPRAAANVHQGGIGTLAQALRAGRPQLIIPFYADQMDNARRAVILGVARSVRPKRYAVGSAARELKRLLGMAAFGARALEVRDRLRAEDGARQGADFALRRLTSSGGS